MSHDGIIYKHLPFSSTRRESDISIDQVGVYKVCIGEERNLGGSQPVMKTTLSPSFVVLGESQLWTMIQGSWEVWQQPLSALHDKTACQWAIFKWDGARGLERREARTWGLAVSHLPFLRWVVQPLALMISQTVSFEMHSPQALPMMPHFRKW